MKKEILNCIEKYRVLWTYWTPLVFVFYNTIIPTQQFYNYLAQFDWPRAIWKHDLDFNKFSEQEFLNIFFVQISKISYFTYNFEVNMT